MGVPLKWMVYKGKSPSKMDDDWGYPYFRKPNKKQLLLSNKYVWCV